MTNPTRALPGILVMTGGLAMAVVAALPPVRALAASSPLVAVAQCLAIAIVVTGLDSLMPRKREANVRLVENDSIANVSVRTEAARRSAAA